VVLQPSIRIFVKTLLAFIPDTITANKQRWLGSNHFGAFKETMLVPEFPSHGLIYLVITLFTQQNLVYHFFKFRSFEPDIFNLVPVSAKQSILIKTLR
jgi:hypothetical protein